MLRAKQPSRSPLTLGRKIMTKHKYKTLCVICLLMGLGLLACVITNVPIIAEIKAIVRRIGGPEFESNMVIGIASGLVATFLDQSVRHKAYRVFHQK